AERARANHCATLIDLFTYRIAPHSTSDDPTRYRPEDEGQNWPYGDPIERLSRHLIRLGEWSPERHKQLEAELVDHVREVGREAESYGTMQTGPHFSVKTMFEDVFQEMPWHLRRQRQELGVRAMPGMSTVQALNSALDVMLARHPDVVIFGADVGFYGGVFRVAEGTQKKHGEPRGF